MIATDYIKDIKKVKDISGKTIFSASIYRMKCDTKNIPEKIPSIFDKAEELKDDDGTGFFENSTKTCEKESDYRFLNLNNIKKTPTILCFFQKCLNLDKIECKKNVSAENCALKDQWISGFLKHENGSYYILSVKFLTA
uniref:Uncharacterized protein n=1 Tax=Panagrolaimus sp. PS1159 TaxID=55785 RepID=A0AC35FKG3_9BILA